MTENTLTKATYFTLLTVSFPDAPLGTGHIQLQHNMIVGLEFFEASEIYSFYHLVDDEPVWTLDANGDGYCQAPTPDGDGTSSALYKVFRPLGDSQKIGVPYNAGGLHLTTLMAAAATSYTVDAIVTLLAAYATDAELAAAIADYLPLTGGTLTGQLNSSGTDHYGFRLLSLTTAQRDALTPAGGEMIYNSTDSEIQAYDGSTWKTVGSSTGGDVVGPGSSTDNAVARFDGTTGKLLQNSSVTIDDGLPRIRGTRDGYGSWFLFPGSASWSGFSFSKSIIMSESTGKYAVVTNTPGTATIPIFTIRGDTDTGIGTAGDDQLSLIAGNVEAAQVDTNATANQTKMLIKDTAGTLRRVAIYNDGTRDLLYLV